MSRTEKKERKSRIGAKVREAVRLMVEEGRKRSEAAEVVGLTDDGLYRALKRSDVCALRSQLMAGVRDAEASRSFSRLADLADNAESEPTKYRANELLLGLGGFVPASRQDVRVQHESTTPGLIIINATEGYVGPPKGQELQWYADKGITPHPEQRREWEAEGQRCEPRQIEGKKS
jgi:DNA-binding phage protein